MLFLDTIFGRKKPTTATAANALAEHEAQLRDAPGRIARARAALLAVADMSDEEHARAEEELSAALRSASRLEAQAGQLRAAHDRALREEAAAALQARAIAAQKRVDTEHPSLIKKYEVSAQQTADAAGSLESIEQDVSATNAAIMQARREDPAGSHPNLVIGTTERFRTKPDSQDPDQVVEEVEWGSYEYGRWRRAGVFVEHKGETRPVGAGFERRVVKRTIPGRIRKGVVLSSPIHGLRLPAARIDGPTFWPRGQL